MGIPGPITGNYGLTMTSRRQRHQLCRFLEGANTYTGNTIISSGVFALALNGSISNSPSISIAAGAALDVSSIMGTFTLASGQSLTASGYGTMTNVGSANAAVLNGPASGTVSLNSQPITLNYTPTSFTGDATHPSLYVPQGTLSLNGNSFTVNNGRLALGRRHLRADPASQWEHLQCRQLFGQRHGNRPCLGTSHPQHFCQRRHRQSYRPSAAVTSLSIILPPAYDSTSGTFSVTYTGAPNLLTHPLRHECDWPVVGSRHGHCGQQRRFQVTNTPSSISSRTILLDYALSQRSANCATGFSHETGGPRGVSGRRSRTSSGKV